MESNIQRKRKKWCQTQQLLPRAPPGKFNGYDQAVIGRLWKFHGKSCNRVSVSSPDVTAERRSRYITLTNSS